MKQEQVIPPADAKEYLTKLKQNLDSWDAGSWSNRDIYEAFKADPNGWDSFEQWLNEMKHLLRPQESNPGEGKVKSKEEIRDYAIQLCNQSNIATDKRATFIRGFEAGAQFKS